MVKKILSWIFAVGVLLLAVTPAVGILFDGPSGPGANEVQSKAPSLKNSDGTFNDAVLSDTAAWLSDHFYGRQELITDHNVLTAQLFGISAAEKVILGQDGWLFYAPTLDDYTGTSPMTQRQQYSAVRNLVLMQEYCHSQDREFAFMIAPNKNSLYGMYMPNYGVTAQVGSGQLFQQALTSAGVTYVDLFAALGAQEEILYFAHDSHWNNKGAALGADCVNETFGIQSSYYTGDFSQTQHHGGDLYSMLYPSRWDSEKDFLYGGTLEYTRSDNKANGDTIFLETQGTGEKSLLCYRDSFGNLLYPYLADSFGAARFSRSTAYDLTQEGDCVLVELVERNLHYLYTYLPVMPAPQRELELPDASGTAALTVKEATAPADTQKVTGTLPEAVDADSPVYIVCDGQAYEAFCLDSKFGAYVPQGEIQGIAFYSGGTLQLLTA